MKKVVVTGVTGQTGSYMVEYLLKNTNYEIVGVVRRLSVPNHENISHINDPRFVKKIADISDKSSITNLIAEEKPDYFINFAANSFVGNSWDMPYSHMENNFMGVLHQLEAIKNFCPSCRYYNAGSSEEFGNVDYSPQNEKHPLKPRSPYGVSKVAARQLIKVYRESYELYAIQGQLFNHESPRRGEEFVSRKITLGVSRIKKAIDRELLFAPIELGNLDAQRDWSHAYDFVDGIWRMLNQEDHRLDLYKYHVLRNVKTSAFWAKYLKEYVLASGEVHSIRKFVEESFKVAGITGYWREGTYKENETFESEYGTLVKINPKFYRPAEVELLCGDSTLARTDLGWNPEYNFESLVREMTESEIWKANQNR